MLDGLLVMASRWRCWVMFRCSIFLWLNAQLLLIRRLLGFLGFVACSLRQKEMEYSLHYPTVCTLVDRQDLVHRYPYNAIFDKMMRRSTYNSKVKSKNLCMLYSQGRVNRINSLWVWRLRVHPRVPSSC